MTFHTIIELIMKISDLSPWVLRNMVLGLHFEVVKKLNIYVYNTL